MNGWSWQDLHAFDNGDFERALNSISARKHLLCAVAIGRLEDGPHRDARSRFLIGCAECEADDLITQEEFENARLEAENRLLEFENRLSIEEEYSITLQQIGVYEELKSVVAVLQGDNLPDTTGNDSGWAILNDIFSTPFQPVAFDRRWRTSTSVGVAQMMYDARDFTAMPILADALQDAGCEDEAILAHCRDNGPHVRGCWVVDLVLGKS